MLNKYLLTFQSKNLETEYRESQKPVVKHQYKLFTIQAVLYMVFFSVYYFKNSTYFHIILGFCGLIILILIACKFIVDRHPYSINYILPMFQILMGLIQTIDYLIPYENQYYIENSAPNFNWFYGFQSCYFHLALLIQGYLIWPQIIVISGIIIAYISYASYPSAEYVSLFLSFFSVLIGMIVIKYSIESNKRLQFLHSRERKKWFKIIESVLEQSIIVIKLDKQQDQLRIHQMNQISKEILRVDNDQDLRTILRNMKVAGESCQEKQLEQVIRNMLSYMSPNNERRKSEKYIKQFECTSQILNQSFKVQLVNYFVDEQQMIIMATENAKNTGNNIFKQAIDIRNRMLKSLSIFGLKSFTKLNSDKLKELICLNYFASIDLWMRLESIKNARKICTSSIKMIQILQITLGDRFNIKNKIKSQKFTVNINSILMIITSLLQLERERDSMIGLHLKSKNDDFSHQLKVTMVFNNIHMNNLIKNYLKRPQYFNTNPNNTMNLDFQNQLIFLDTKLKRNQPLTSLSFVCIKYLLVHYGVSNKINIKNKENRFHLSFQILCQ